MVDTKEEMALYERHVFGMQKKSSLFCMKMELCIPVGEGKGGG